MHPILFKIGPITLHSYGLLLAIAFLVGLRIAIYYAKREKIDSSRIVDLVLYIFLSALIGAKILLLLVDFNYYREDWRRLLNIYQLGGVYYGGFILAVVISLWYVHKHKMSFWRTADVLCMGVAGGQIFGRAGCFLAGCCWGKPAPTGFPLAVTFTDPFAHEQIGTPLNVPLHPAQLYESIPLVIVFLLLAYSFNHRKFAGQQLGLYLLLYSILRFIVEFFRGDPRGSVFHGLLSTSQLISILAFVCGLIVFFIRRRHPLPAPTLSPHMSA